MQKQNGLCNSFARLLAATATAFTLTPGLAQSATLKTLDLSGGGGDAGATLDPLFTVTRSAPANRRTMITRLSGAINRSDRISQWDKSDAIDRGSDESRDLAQNINDRIRSNIIRNVNPSWNRTVVNRANLFPAWARPGWGALRPWDAGWYGNRSYTAWTWWRGRSRAWGTTSLASRASINRAIDNAISNYIPYIVVPKTNYKLFYGTELPSGGESLSFMVQANSTDYQLNANCKEGTLNGQEPMKIEEAELINAACQVAYGPA
jgi:hypothetical protein